MHDKRLWLSAFILALSVTVIFEAVPANAQWWLVPPLKTTSYIRGQGRIRIRREETEATHQLYFRPCWWNYDICADQWGDSQVSGYYGGWTSLGGFGPGPQTTVSFNTSAFVNPENLIDVRVWSDHYDFDSGFIGYARHAINNPYGTVDQVHGAIEFNGRFYCGDQNNPATWRDISDLVWSSNYFLGAACFEDWRRVSSGGDRDFNDISLVADLVPGTTLVHRHIGYAGTVPLSSCAAYGYAYDESRGGARQDVRVYVNSTLVATVTANQYNTSDPGVCAAVGGNCGFSLDLTPYVTTGVTYQIEARTNDVLWGNRWVPLTDSPKTLTCVVPTPTTTPTPTVTPTNIATPTATATAGPRLTPTPLPTATSTSGPRATPTPINTATYTPSPTQTNTPTPTVTHTPSPAPTNTSTPTATPTALAALTLSRDHEFLLLCGATVGEPTQVLRGVLSGDTYSGQLIRIVIVDPNGSTGNYYTYTDPFGRFILDASSVNGGACFGSSLTGDWSAQAFYDPLGLVSNPVQWSVSWFIIQTTK